MSDFRGKEDRVSGRIFLCVCLNPVIQETIVFDSLSLGEVNRTSIHRTDAAGKGICAARVLGQVGEKAIHLSHLGGPTRGHFLSLCAEDDIELAWVEAEAPIRSCVTVVDKARNCATELVEEAEPVGEACSELLVERFALLLPRVDVVLLSGTVAAGYTPGIMGRLASLATAAGKGLYLDIKGRDLLDCLRFRPVCVKPNLEELSATLGYSPESTRGDEAARKLVREAGKEFFDRYGSALVVTRGPRSTLYWDGARLGERPTDAVRVLNPIGSGDAFGVGLARSLEMGNGLDAAVEEGNRLGGLNAAQLKPGSILSPA